MAKKTTRLRLWTKEDMRALKTLAREKTKTTVTARKTQAERRSNLSPGGKIGRDGVGRGEGRERAAHAEGDEMLDDLSRNATHY